MKTIAIGLLATLMLAVPISQAKESAVWVPPGPTVGSVFPDALSLQDQTGKQQNLKALLGKNGAAVFFVRSADWCPFCMRQLVDANSKLDEFRQLGLNVVSVSIDTPDKLASFHQKQAIGYTMLSDPDGVIVEKLGIRDPQYAQGSMAYGVARPMIFIVNPQLKITHKFAEESYRNRPDLTKVLAELNKK